jgi:hypothetical protein
VRLVLVSPIGGDTGGSGNMSTSLSNVARLTAHPKFVWAFNADYDGESFIITLYYVYVFVTIHTLEFLFGKRVKLKKKSYYSSSIYYNIRYF